VLYSEDVKDTDADMCHCLSCECGCHGNIEATYRLTNAQPIFFLYNTCINN